MPDLPFLVFCPYLPLQKPIEFGPWWLGSLAEFDGPWLSDEFERAARQFVSCFKGPTGDDLGCQAILAKRATGADGIAPTEEEQLVLEAVLHLATLDANPPWTNEDGNRGWMIATSDNSDLFVWPIDIDEGYISTRRGAIVCVRTGGPRFTNPDFEIRAPLELPTPSFASRVDADTAHACYNALTSSTTPPQAIAPRRLRLTIDWLAKAWRNSQSITWEDRVVILKVAFEVLLGSSERWKGAIRLRKLFDATLGATDTRGDLLWSCKETERHTVGYRTKDGQKKSADITDLQHWYMYFGKARNEIIHQGSTRLATYDEENAYKGPLFHIAERVLREAIKVVLTPYGFSDAWRGPGYRLMRSIAEELEREGVSYPEEE